MESLLVKDLDSRFGNRVWIVELKLLCGIPKQPLKVNHLVLNHLDFLLFEAFLHGSGRREMMFSRKETCPVYYAVRGYLFVAMSCIHSPTHHPGAHFSTQVGGNCPITGYAALWNKLCYLKNVIKKTVSFSTCI